MIGAGARIANSRAHASSTEPFASLISHLFTASSAHRWEIFGYWGALGSVLLFLAYFPYSKHIHIFAAPLKYFFAREQRSGVLPAVDLDMEALSEDVEQSIGAAKLEQLAWPRLLDAYACIQCNRCQDVCPATATGKSLSPAALEINKRMELNDLAANNRAFENGAASPQALLQFALTPEAAWACTTCGACMEVCPVQDEQMLDIIDIRRHQVMMEGEFPTQLQTAFRGMERNKNPWGINHEQRMAWADGLKVKTTAENPQPDILYWVGCAASYDPAAQKTARALVQLLEHAGVDYAVLGKRECCTGDSARRGGNEVLYRELANGNVATLNEARPKRIVASCPHCMNALGGEYRQLGGEYQVIHHTQLLEELLAAGKLQPKRLATTVTYHDPCYLGRHNGVYDAPRNLLKVLGSEVRELKRNRSNAFCCGAGGAQFWKEEEPGTERVSENRFREVQQALAKATDDRTLAVACPFCKSMLGSTPAKEQGEPIQIKDVAELLWEAIATPSITDVSKEQNGSTASPFREEKISAEVSLTSSRDALSSAKSQVASSIVSADAALFVETRPGPDTADASEQGTQPRRKWAPKAAIPAAKSDEDPPLGQPTTTGADAPSVASSPVAATSSAIPSPRSKWVPTKAFGGVRSSPEEMTPASQHSPEPTGVVAQTSAEVKESDTVSAVPARKKWSPQQTAASTGSSRQPAPPGVSSSTTSQHSTDESTGAIDAEVQHAGGTEGSTAATTAEAPPSQPTAERKKWQPKGKS